MDKLELNCEYVTIKIRQIKTDETGRIYEEVVEQKVPDFIAQILTGAPASSGGKQDGHF